MEEITKNDFQEKIHQNDKPLVLDFFSDMCQPCKQLAPVLETVEDKYRGKVDFFKINIMGNQEIFSEYGVQSVPTIIIFKSGSPVAESMGYKDESALSAWVEKNI
tara:strand:+ start:995 stop:1309 length:315 start_codon:yes stop_codon:yes gene_type:complete